MASFFEGLLALKSCSLPIKGLQGEGGSARRRRALVGKNTVYSGLTLQILSQGCGGQAKESGLKVMGTVIG